MIEQPVASYKGSSHCFRDCVCLLMTLCCACSPPTTAADTVRVKAMNARLEEDGSVSDLPTYLLNALHPHGSAPMALGSRAVHAAGGRPAVAEDGDAGEQEEPSFPGRRERDWQRRGGRR